MTWRDTTFHCVITSRTASSYAARSRSRAPFALSGWRRAKGPWRLGGTDAPTILTWRAHVPTSAESAHTCGQSRATRSACETQFLPSLSGPDPRLRLRRSSATRERWEPRRETKEREEEGRRGKTGPNAETPLGAETAPPRGEGASKGGSQIRRTAFAQLTGGWR